MSKYKGLLILPILLNLWVNAFGYNPKAVDITNAPNGNIASTNVQAAINELDTKKVPTTTTVNGHALSSNVTVTASDVSLGNVNNTSDADKPISTATQTALNAKQNTITTGTTAEYLRGDLSLGTFPTNVSTFTNDASYTTLAAVSGVGYVTGTPWTGMNYLTNISGQDLSTANNGTSKFIAQNPIYPVGTNVGIGSTNPGSALDVKGTVRQNGFNVANAPQVYYVSASTGNDSNNGLSSSAPWATMTKVNNSKFNPGDTVNIEGTFTDGLYASPVGLPNLPITFQQWVGKSPWIINGGGTLNNDVRITNGNYFVLSDATTYAGVNGGVKVISSNNFTLSNLTSYSNTTYSVDGDLYQDDNDFGIGINGGSLGSSNFNVNNCTSYSNGGAGFELYGIINNATYTNDTTYANGNNIGQNGFEFFNTDYHYTSGWTNLSGNIYYQSTPLVNSESIWRVIDFTDQVELTYNAGNYSSLSTNQYDYHAGNLYINIGKSPGTINIEWFKQVISNLKVINCLSYNNIQYSGTPEGNGYNFDSGTQNSYLINSTAYGNGGHGSFSNVSKGITIEGNLFYSNTSGGTASGQYSPQTTWYSNTIVSNGTVGAYAQGLFINAPTNGTYIIKNNIVANNNSNASGAGIGSSNGVTGITENYNDSYNNLNGNYSGAVSAGINDIQLDPLFVNSTKNDYRLLLGSPAIGTGANVGLTKDINGVSIPTGSGYDMGAYQTLTVSGENVTYATSGNIGIGTLFPQAVLNVADTSSTGGELMVTSTNQGQAVAGIILRNSYNGINYDGNILSSFYGNTNVNGVNVAGMTFQSPRDISADGFNFASHSGTSRMWISSYNGNVGIGSTNPGQALDVNGTVRATAYYAGSSAGASGSGSTSCLCKTFVNGICTSMGTCT